jgi:type IV pilus assembly protein PilB
MTQRRTIGDILMGLGRITEADVARALEYQRQSGGFFGAALVACGILTEEQIEWGLASQFDLPYVFPKAEEIDVEAAAMVTPAWALANLTLPIMRTANTLTVVVESPTRTKAVEDLRTRTDMEISLALASRSNIRELIRQVFDRPPMGDEATPSAIGMPEALAAVVATSAPLFGVSVVGSEARVWWGAPGSTRQRPLSGDWRAELGAALRPALPEAASNQRRAWTGQLTTGGVAIRVDAEVLADESASEYLFRLHATPTPTRALHPTPLAAIQSEVRLLARSGTARFVFTSDDQKLGAELLPRLPAMLLDPPCRSIYVHAHDRQGAGEAFSRRLPAERAGWRAEIESLRAFQFDAVTLDLEGDEAHWLASALDLGAVTFLLGVGGADVGPAFDAGVRWHLHAAPSKDGELAWSLEPLHV